MSNVLSVPDHIADRIRARQEAGKKSAVMDAIVGSQEGVSFPRISIRAGRYRLCEMGVETVVGTSLDVVIVGANPKVSKVFYNKAYDSSADNVRPACFSNDGIKPDASVESPACDNCAGCPNNELGSKILPSGARSKLCADQRHLAVVAAADPNKVYALTVPVSGMKALREYLKELGNYGVAPEEAVTELGFDDSASYPKITFTHKGYVPQKAIDAIEAIADSDPVKVATRQMAPTGSALAAPEKKPELKAPAVDEAYEEEAEAPKVKAKEKPKVEPVKASDDLAANIASLFDE